MQTKTILKSLKRFSYYPSLTLISKVFLYNISTPKVHYKAFSTGCQKCRSVIHLSRYLTVELMKGQPVAFEVCKYQAIAKLMTFACSGRGSYLQGQLISIQYCLFFLIITFFFATFRLNFEWCSNFYKKYKFSYRMYGRFEENICKGKVT